MAVGMAAEQAKNAPHVSRVPKALHAGTAPLLQQLGRHMELQGRLAALERAVGLAVGGGDQAALFRFPNLYLAAQPCKVFQTGFCKKNIDVPRSPATVLLYYKKLFATNKSSIYRKICLDSADATSRQAHKPRRKVETRTCRWQLMAVVRMRRRVLSVSMLRT